MARGLVDHRGGGAKGRSISIGPAVSPGSSYWAAAATSQQRSYLGAAMRGQRCVVAQMAARPSPPPLQPPPQQAQQIVRAVQASVTFAPCGSAPRSSWVAFQPRAPAAKPADEAADAAEGFKQAVGRHCISAAAASCHTADSGVGSSAGSGVGSSGAGASPGKRQLRLLEHWARIDKRMQEKRALASTPEARRAHKMYTAGRKLESAAAGAGRREDEAAPKLAPRLRAASGGSKPVSLRALVAAVLAAAALGMLCSELAAPLGFIGSTAVAALLPAVGAGIGALAGAVLPWARQPRRHRRRSRLRRPRRTGSAAAGPFVMDGEPGQRCSCGNGAARRQCMPAFFLP